MRSPPLKTGREWSEGSTQANSGKGELREMEGQNEYSCWEGKTPLQLRQEEDEETSSHLTSSQESYCLSLSWIDWEKAFGTIRYLGTSSSFYSSTQTMLVKGLSLSLSPVEGKEDNTTHACLSLATCLTMNVTQVSLLFMSSCVSILFSLLCTFLFPLWEYSNPLHSRCRLWTLFSPFHCNR